MTTPADQLRAAAELLREAASHATPGPWRTHDTHLDRGGHTATVLTDRRDLNDTELVAWLPTMSHEPWNEDRNAWRNAGWMALMDPGVGLALVKWLDSWTGVDLTEHGPMPEDAQHALAVARQILGTTEQPTGEFELRGTAEIRAAVLREAADALGRMDYDADSNDYGYDAYRDAWNGGVMDGAGLLRRMADEQPEACSCTTGSPGMYEGPARDCPQHGKAQQAEPATVSCGAQAFVVGWHYAHDWEPQPGMTPVHCPGTTPAPAEETKPEDFRVWLGRQHVAGTGTGVQPETEAPPVCGDRSPAMGSLCQRSPGHTYPHRDAKQKGTESSSWWGRTEE